MKRLKRILSGVGILLALVVLLLVGPVLVDYAIGGGRLEALTNVSIPGVNGSPDVRSYVARPQREAPFPVVILIHEFYGLNESILAKADALAAEGYLVIAPDTFRGSTTALIPRAIYQVMTTPPGQVNADLDSVHAWLVSQPDVDATRIAVLGFCYGGRASLGYSLHNNRIAATVIFYGSPVTDPAVLKTLPGPVLGIFGGADQSIPVEDVQAFEAALQEAGVPHEVSIYDGQPHAFVQDINAGGAQGQAWAQMLAFLDKHLKNTKPSSRANGQPEYRLSFDWRYYALLAYEHAFRMVAYSH